MHVHYRPADFVLDYLESVDFVAVVGPTASGKTTLIDNAARRDPSLHKVLTVTSRAPRPGERDGVDYHFCARQDMEERIARGEYVNVAPRASGELYASAPEDYSASGVAVAAIFADVIPTFRSLPFKSVRVVYVLPPSWDEWQRRIQAHHFAPGQLQKRLAEAQRSLQFALGDTDTIFVINDDLSRAAEDFIHAALGKSRTARQQTSRARAVVRGMLDKLDAIWGSKNSSISV